MGNLISNIFSPVMAAIITASPIALPIEGQTAEPPKVILGEVSPNPFGTNRPDSLFADNSFTTIPYTVTGQDSADVVITIDNKIITMQGKTEYFLDTLVNKRLTPGNYSVEFHPEKSLQRGIYFVATKDIYQNTLGRALRITYLGNEK